MVSKIHFLVILILLNQTSSTSCSGSTSLVHCGSNQANKFDFQNYGATTVQQRSDHESFEKSISKRSDDCETQGQNVRSIAVDSKIQLEEERTWFQDKKHVDETVMRTENGSSKIIDILKKERLTLTKRIGPTALPKLYVPKIPEECKNMTICENVPNYPRELADGYIAMLGDKIDIGIPIELLELDKPEIMQRNGARNQNNEFCRSKTNITIPEAARNVEDNKWYFILNNKSKLLVAYQIEICEHADGPCAKNMAVFNLNYNATCQQKYIYRVMPAIDINGNLLKKALFKLPSCCSCVATYVGTK